MGILGALVKVFFLIGLFGFGGGYAIVALIRHFVVIEEKWLTNTQFIDVLAISQITPGPIAINSATFIGYKMGGLIGSILATISSVLAPFILVFSFSYFFHKINSEKFSKILTHLRPMTFALLISATYNILLDSIIDWKEFILFLLSLIFCYKTKWNLLLRILIIALLGEIIYLLS
ncbi:MAG: chromate transporter [Dictyoglomus sp.]|nr:chromate transporter [Dictyoglomus sp.]MCX7942154.1 chromate transporter [Dictyoglomaceae bacterium]MDW8188513.1 chromate transporter [Dictyoglomus sp.]